MNTQQIAERLVALCREGKNEEALNELYADAAVSVEPEGAPAGALGNAQGLDALREKGRKFNEAIETVHGGEVSDPIVAGNWFSVRMSLDVTMKGRGRVMLTEICVYGIRDGKIVREQFFYDAG